MTFWTPSERPEWVRAINAGEIAPIAEEVALPLTRTSLIEEAMARQGGDSGSGRPSASQTLAGFDHPDFPAEPAFESLERFLAALEEEARLSPMGRWITRRFLLRLLEVRLQLMAYLERDPGVQEEQIRAPLFVAGAPRTGTTILHALLASDHRHRVPEGWELLRPVPPPSPDPLEFAADARIALADRELVLPQTVVSGLLSIHEYGGRKPKECLSAMSFAFQSEEFTTRYAIPSFEGWLEASDKGAAYRMHRLVLQILQRRSAHRAWVLKSPVHLHELTTLFEIYPDARVAITHRDPLTLIASLTSLIANLRWVHSDTVDVTSIAESQLRRYRASFDRLVDWSDEGELPTRQIHHSHFADFREAPIETVRALYARFGMEWSSAAETEMRAALVENPSNRHGEHVYSRDDLGGDPARLRRDFARYQTRFDVPSDT
ncbi:MAG: sulfotransferase [bacterium]|nr:sulfotransferase [bacterium]